MIQSIQKFMSVMLISVMLQMLSANPVNAEPKSDQKDGESTNKSAPKALHAGSIILRSLTEEQKSLILSHPKNIKVLNSFSGGQMGMIVYHAEYRMKNETWETIKHSLVDYYDSFLTRKYRPTPKDSASNNERWKKTRVSSRDGSEIILDWWNPTRYALESSISCQPEPKITSTTTTHFWVCSDGSGHKIIFFRYTNG